MMHFYPLLLTGLNLFGQAARVDELGHQIRSGGGISPFDLAIVVVVLVGIAGFIALLARVSARAENRPFNSASKLFQELCREHRLNFWDRALLRRVAQASEVTPAARVFLMREAFDPNKPGLMRYERSLNNLRAKLFGASLAGEGVQASATPTNVDQ